MYAPNAHLKFLYAFLLPPLLILLSIVGGDDWEGYKLFATALVVAGGICLAGVPQERSNKILAGMLYMVVMEAVVIFLP